MCEMTQDPQATVNEQFLERCQGMNSRDFGAHIGPDHIV